jgi:hypothetical protein
MARGQHTASWPWRWRAVRDYCTGPRARLGEVCTGRHIICVPGSVSQAPAQGQWPRPAPLMVINEALNARDGSVVPRLGGLVAGSH